MEHEVLDAVQRLKTSEFGVTGIKIELEAVFGRDNYRNYCSIDSDCRGVEAQDCDYCDNDRRVNCDDCDGTAMVDCSDCSGRGQRRQLSTGNMVTHRACSGTGQVDCESCAGTGEVECDECETPEATCAGIHLNGGTMATFNDYFLSKLVPLGLAEESDVGFSHRGNTYARKHRPIGALKYSRFYVDHSVDTECTFTLSVEEDPSVVLKLPEIVRAFTSIADIIGNGIDVRGAGMHMALLNSRGAVYPYEHFDEQRFRNFQKSMHLLMPALYFLGSVDETSRGLHYRQPYVNSPGHGSKYWAVNYAGGALEYRIFETCYQRPEAILDNIVVIANCMRHWTSEYTPHGLSRITRSTRFGVDNSNRLDRFYRNRQHFELLFAGLEHLKPTYYTAEQLCEMRQFKITPSKLDEFMKESDTEIDRQYEEYCERYHKLVSLELSRYVNKIAHERKLRMSTRNTAAIEKIKLEASEKIAQVYTLRDKNTFRRKLLERNQEGQYTLEEA